MAEGWIELVVPVEAASQTLLAFLSDSLPLEPEDLLRHLIVSGNVLIEGEIADPKRQVRTGERVVVERIEEQRRAVKVEVVRAPVLYEDDDLIVLNKPAGCTVVRERRGHACAFQNGVLEYLRGRPAAAQEAMRRRYRPRAVHRLDRDTTGAVIFAKSREGERHLSRQFLERTVGKEYLAVLHGEPAEKSGRIEAAVSEVPGSLDRVEIAERGGKGALTDYEVLERFRGFALVRAMPRTGRRHQVRIHFAHIGHPVVGDRIYGGVGELMLSTIKRRYRHKEDEPEKPLIDRPALHASAISFLPVGAESSVRVEAPLPRDMEVLLKMLRKYAPGGSK